MVLRELFGKKSEKFAKLGIFLAEKKSEGCGKNLLLVKGNIMFSTSRKGVTLVELLIVVLILAALSAIAIPRISQSATNAKQKACHTNIDVINSSIELYNADTGGYPADLTVVTTDTSYFPDGAPVCPVDGSTYPATLVNNRVDASGHTH